MRACLALPTSRSGDSPTWRQMILAACRQQKMHADLPVADDADFHEWEDPLDFLEQCILWDTDCRRCWNIWTPTPKRAGKSKNSSASTTIISSPSPRNRPIPKPSGCWLNWSS